MLWKNVHIKQIENSIGILSGNDYSANVQQIGIGKVFTFLKNINDPTVAATVAATATAPEIVLYYEQLWSITKTLLVYFAKERLR